jgi:hypothetical protein
MRFAMWFTIGCLILGVLVLASLTENLLPFTDLPPLDAQQREYQEELRRSIEHLLEAERRHAPEEEIKQIRRERKKLVDRYIDYNKTRDR